MVVLSAARITPPAARITPPAARITPPAARITPPAPPQGGLEPAKYLKVETWQ